MVPWKFLIEFATVGNTYEAKYLHFFCVNKRISSTKIKLLA